MNCLRPQGAQLATLDSLPSWAARPHPGRAVPCTHEVLAPRLLKQTG